MIVGVPAETKPGENRVAITPDGVREVVLHGHQVLVEHGAGLGSSISDTDFGAAGARAVTAEDAWGADLVVKVKEPQEPELDLLREGLVLFTFLHLVAYPEVAEALLAHYLERDWGGRGVLLGGAPGVQPGRVVVLGAGNVGWNSAWIAQGMEAEVLLLDKNLDRLRFVDQIHRGRIMTLASNRAAIERAVGDADLVIGAVLIAGGRAPQLVSEDMVRAMRPGSVIVDMAVDQGGCVETTRETTHDDPVYERHGVIHYAVGNVPGAVPHTSTYALTNATLPYVVEVAERGVRAAAQDDRSLLAGVATVGGALTNAAAAGALGQMAADPLEALSAS